MPASPLVYVNCMTSYPFSYSIDATREPGPNERMLGRLVNHGRRNEVNAKMKVIMTDKEQPALCLFSTKLINSGQEVLYDYGVNNLPWEKNNFKVIFSLAQMHDIILVTCDCFYP